MRGSKGQEWRTRSRSALSRMKDAKCQDWRTRSRSALSRLVDSRALSGSILFLFQKVSVRQQLETSPSVLMQNDEVEEGSSGKKMRLADGSSLDSPASRPPGPPEARILPAGLSWTPSRDEVIGPPSFFSMGLFFSSTVLFCSGLFYRRRESPVL